MSVIIMLCPAASPFMVFKRELKIRIWGFKKNNKFEDIISSGYIAD
jgi:hypothetical protein